MEATQPTGSGLSTTLTRPRVFWAIFGALFVFRLFFALFLPFGLVGDEAYYWDWGRGEHLDFGYFSKPPLIGWIMGGVGRLTANAQWGIKFAALFFATTSALLLFWLGRSMFDAQTGRLAALMALVTPAYAALSLILTIDGPLVLLWTGAMLSLWKFIQSTSPSGPQAQESLPSSNSAWLWAFCLAACLALGNLAKQMMLFFPVIAILGICLVKQHRTCLRSPLLWAALLLPLLALAPPILWNAQHDWITFQHTAGHFDSGGSVSVGKRISRFFEFVGSQAGMLSPLIWIAAMVALVRGMGSWRDLSPAARFLLLFSAPALAIVHVMALRQRMLPNWPAVYYPAALLLLAAAWQGHLTHLLPKRWGRLGGPAIITGAALIVFVYLIAPITSITGLAGHKADPLERMRGWREAGIAAGEFLAQTPRPDETFLCALGHRYNASQLAFYTPGQPILYRYEKHGGVHSQYEIWNDPEEDQRLGQDALILYHMPDKPLYHDFRKAFESTERIGEIDVEVGHGERRYFQVFLCRNLLAWPRPSPPDPSG